MTIPFNPVLLYRVSDGPTVYWTPDDHRRQERLVGSPLRLDLFGFAWLVDRVNEQGETLYRRAGRSVDVPLDETLDPAEAFFNGERFVALDRTTNGKTVYVRPEEGEGRRGTRTPI